MDACDIVYLARTSAGLSQQQLGERAGVAQHAISRIERGHVGTGFATVRDLVRACGFELDISLATFDDSLARHANRMLEMSPEKRLEHSVQLGDTIRQLRGKDGQ